MAPRLRPSTRYPPQTCPLQTSPSANVNRTAGDRGTHIASSNTSECATEVLTVKVQHILRRGPAVPPFLITGPNDTSGIDPEVLPADGDHLSRGGRGPTPTTFPTNSRAPKKTPQHLASKFQCRTDTQFRDLNHCTKYRASLDHKENLTFQLKPKMCHAPQTLTRQAVKNQEFLEPSVAQQRKTFGNAQEAFAANVDHYNRHSPAQPIGYRKRRVLQPVQRETGQCILPHGACVDASCRTQWVTNYMENFCFSQNACSLTSQRKSAPRPPSNFRKLRPATQRTEYQAAFGPKVLSAKFDFRLFIQLHGNGSK
ncbi:uncharacterized protein LOC113634591 isoform X1 [Tachysurus fulvidraco]|uniref:uncharacterized protein LOC113634591 isoform X1 n=1 Tax=Tachysurus fulvidraco TaxID=1234273 RepID=UPI000F4F376C|nr:uncharacterized protein LOC113634591 isoform X1 [Tachysurus fulvidraco]XP_026989467.1 uncharacterized protein LOC113634591 isoform X1 [Tachysurus fulvidraco]XP_026989476.1 uncharacterized protein LOC113634591 isoform X1 [Tachysurus fulvidraco]